MYIVPKAVRPGVGCMHKVPITQLRDGSVRQMTGQLRGEAEKVG